MFSNQFGPAQVWLPDGDEPPQTAYIPPAPDDRTSVMQYKGQGVSWLEWARTLARITPPTQGSWGLAEVPDGSTPQQALNFVRSAAIAGTPVYLA